MNGRKKTAELWTILRRYYPDFSVKDETIYKKLAPNKPYSDTTFRSLVSDLYRLARDFVAYQEFAQNKYLRINNTIIGALKRLDETTYLKARKEALKLYDETPQQSIEILKWRQELEDYHYQYITLFRHFEATKSLQNSVNLLDHSLLATKLMYFSLMRNRERITGEKYDYWLEAELLAFLQKKPLKEVPLVHLYFLLVQLQKKPLNSVIIDGFIKYYKQNKEKLMASEARHLLTAISNIALWNIENGHLDYLSLRFRLMQIQVDEQLYLVEGQYLAPRYQYFMTTAIQAGELDWATEFHKNNLEKVEEDKREHLGTMMCAYLYFARGEYEKQNAYMSKMEANDYKFNNIQGAIFFRLLAIKTAFVQLGDEPGKMQVRTYESMMNGYRLFIRRKKEEQDKELSPNFLLGCENFRKALQLIYNQQYGQRKKNIKLEEEILALRPIRELPWLLQVLRAFQTGTDLMHG